MTSLKSGAVGPSWELDNKNREMILERLGLKPDDVMFVRQIHSRDVVFTDQYSRNPLTEADGIISGGRNDALAVTVADCMPIFLYDRVNDIRAVLHSGWKGTGIALNALGLMERRYNTVPSDVTAVLGPAIGSCCYKVDGQRAEVFSAEWGDEAVIEKDGSLRLSLETANRLMLERAGVKEIICSGVCTACSDNLGSFRREGPDNFSHMFMLSYLNE